MTDILVYTEEQDNVIAGSVQPDRMVVAVLGGGGGGGAVQSVNGQVGAVVLDAADVGADPAGTASAAVAAHVAAPDPHPQYTTSTEAAAAAPVQSVNAQTGVVVLDTDDVAEGAANLYYTDARAGASAAAAVATHEAAADPHPQYLTPTEGNSAYAPLSHVGAGGTAHAAVVAGGAAGFMTGADKTKLDGVAAGAQVNVPTNLSTTTSATTLTVNSDTGTDATLPAATTAVAGVMTATDKTKLNGVASGAVALSQVVAYAGTAKTLALTDVNTIVDCTSSSAVTITIPPQSSVTWTAGAEIHVRMSGTGLVSIAVGSGVTIPPLTAPVALGGQGAVVTLKRRSADVWALIGLSNIEGVVRGTVLTGLSLANSTPVVATDTVLIGFGKLQAQMGSVADALDTINGVVI